MTEGRSEPLLVDVREAARLLGCGRSLVYQLLATQELGSITVGRLRRIPIADLRAFVEGQAGARPVQASSGDIQEPAPTSAAGR